MGAVLLAIKENTGRVAMLGHNVPAYKLTAFVIAALYAGLAGGLLGSFQSYMPPDAFALVTSGQFVVQTIVGGAGTLVGPLVGAAVWMWLRDNLQLVPGLATLWKLVLGLAFIVLVIGLRRGICGEIAHWWNERQNFAALRAAEAATQAIEATGESKPPIRRAREVTLPLPAPAIGASDIALEVRALARHYGGLKAVDGVSFKVMRGSIHAVIGPNVAGKSTLFKMLLDEISPSSGDVLLFGAKVTGSGVSHTAQFGIAKSNQLNQLFPNLSVRQNLRIAALGRRRGPLRLRSAAAGRQPARGLEEQVGSVLALLDLVKRADTPAHILAYGEKRRLRNRHGTRHQSERAAARRTARRHEPRGTRRHLRLDPRHCTQLHDRDRRARPRRHLPNWPSASRCSTKAGCLRTRSPDEIRRNQRVQDALSWRASHMSLLEIDRINTLYGDSHVLFDLSIRVEQGEVVALLGRNGACKTTTLRSITGRAGAEQRPDPGSMAEPIAWLPSSAFADWALNSSLRSAPSSAVLTFRGKPAHRALTAPNAWSIRADL